MSKINIKYMTDEAIATLKNNIGTVTNNLIKNPNDNSWLYDLINGEVYVTKKYEIEDLVLKVPKDSKDRDTDIYNSILLYERLNSLPLYVLTDERFWSWINFEKGYSVALKYMPINEGNSVFKDHWLFTQGNRRGLFFGVLSRCYFRVALTKDESLPDPYELTKFVIEKPERFRNLSWRSFSSEKKIVLGTLKAEKQVLEEMKMEERTEYFTELAKDISQLGSVMLLDAMSEKDIEDFIYKKYKAMVEADLKNRTIITKIKDTVNKAIRG